MTRLTRLAILDDFQGVALQMGPWDRLPPGLTIEVFRDAVADQDALVARLLPFDAILGIRERTPFPASLLQRLPNLKLLMTTGERNRAFDVAAANAQGVTVCGTPSAGAPTVDITWGLILGLLRDLPAQMASLRAGTWQAHGAPNSVGTAAEGLTLGILGLGKLGTRVARVGQAFGMKTIAWSQNLTAEAAAAVGVTRVEKAALFAQADVVTLHMILSDRSRGIVGAAELGAMKPSACIVNTSRGPLIDQPALIAALTEGRIAGAGLDVFDREPLPLDHPLMACPNTLLTPHLGYVSRQNFSAYFHGAVETIEAYLAGAPIRLLTP
ncbi:D-2-hydroxyacid dehydrogenase family protein [Falsiroseomonas selenitidurans]|uniref:D-2-hydroxyacid dehydrogenase family protein n=1 Tax=Falsiroseomonas selenitidurans TaxID=2716335 RepID=A0ABX1E6R4_9PROT|nr:D-2-hydroxyacid dehydrogenase family protein [Falsiroseomonas selenitidurans]NKC32894.1 D-2-hydroxyacid dehydrogenase family protein [Falsiroseomonas selenitidurans]